MSHFPFFIESPESKIWGKLYHKKLNSTVIRISKSIRYSSDHYSSQEITRGNDAWFIFLVPSSLVQLQNKLVFRVKHFPPEEAVGMNKKKQKEYTWAFCTIRTMFWEMYIWSLWENVSCFKENIVSWKQKNRRNGTFSTIQNFEFTLQCKFKKKTTQHLRSLLD